MDLFAGVKGRATATPIELVPARATITRRRPVAVPVPGVSRQAPGGSLLATPQALRVFDPNVRANPDMCAETIGDIEGFRTGNANASDHSYISRGWQPREGEGQVGDVAIIQHLGKPGSQGWQFGHTGYIGRLNGVLVLISNFNGHRTVTSLPAGYRAYAPPTPRQIVSMAYNGAVSAIGNVGRRVERAVSAMGQRAAAHADQARTSLDSLGSRVQQLYAQAVSPLEPARSQAHATLLQELGQWVHPVSDLYVNYAKSLPDINLITPWGLVSYGLLRATGKPVPTIPEIIGEAAALTRPLQYLPASRWLGGKVSGRPFQPLAVWQNLLQPETYQTRAPAPISPLAEEAIGARTEAWARAKTLAAATRLGVPKALAEMTAAYGGRAAGQSAAMVGFGFTALTDPLTLLMLPLSFGGTVTRRMALASLPGAVGRAVASEVPERAVAGKLATEIAESVAGLIRGGAATGRAEPEQLAWNLKQWIEGVAHPSNVWRDYENAVRAGIWYAGENAVSPEVADAVTDRVMRNLRYEFSEGLRARAPGYPKGLARRIGPGPSPEVSPYEQNIARALQMRGRLEGAVAHAVDPRDPAGYASVADRFKGLQLGRLGEQLGAAEAEAAHHGTLAAELDAQAATRNAAMAQGLEGAQLAQAEAEAAAQRRVAEVIVQAQEEAAAAATGEAAPFGLPPLSLPNPAEPGLPADFVNGRWRGARQAFFGPRAGTGLKDLLIEERAAAATEYKGATRDPARRALASQEMRRIDEIITGKPIERATTPARAEMSWAEQVRRKIITPEDAKQQAKMAEGTYRGWLMRHSGTTDEALLDVYEELHRPVTAASGERMAVLRRKYRLTEADVEYVEQYGDEILRGGWVEHGEMGHMRVGKSAENDALWEKWQDRVTAHADAQMQGMSRGETEYELNRLQDELIASQQEYPQELGVALEALAKTGETDPRAADLVRQSFAETYEPIIRDLQQQIVEATASPDVVARRKGPTDLQAQTVQRAKEGADWVSRAQRAYEYLAGRHAGRVEEMANLARQTIRLAPPPELAAQMAEVGQIDPAIAARLAELQAQEAAARSTRSRLAGVVGRVPVSNVEEALALVREKAEKIGVTVPPEIEAAVRRRARTLAAERAASLQEHMTEVEQRDWPAYFAQWYGEQAKANAIRNMPQSLRGRLQARKNFLVATPEVLKPDVERWRNATRAASGLVDHYAVELFRINKGLNLSERQLLAEIPDRVAGWITRSAVGEIPEGTHIPADTPSELLTFLFSHTRQGETVDPAAFLKADGTIDMGRLSKKENSLLKAGYRLAALYRRFWVEHHEAINYALRILGKQGVGDLGYGYIPKVPFDSPEYELLTLLRQGQGEVVGNIYGAILDRSAYEALPATRSRVQEAVAAQAATGVAPGQGAQYIADNLDSGLSYFTRMKQLVRFGRIAQLVEERFATVADLGPEEAQRRVGAGWVPLSVVRPGTTVRTPIPPLQERLVYPGLQREFEGQVAEQGIMANLSRLVRHYGQPIKLPILLNIRFLLAQGIEQVFNAAAAGLVTAPKSAVEGLLYGNRIIAEEATDCFLHVEARSWADRWSNFAGRNVQKLIDRMTGGLPPEEVARYKQLTREFTVESGFGPATAREMQYGAGQWGTQAARVAKVLGKGVEIGADLLDLGSRICMGVDNLGRTSMFISLLRAGESPEMARKIVSECSVEYGPEMIAGVDSILRNFSWFYRYKRERAGQFANLAKRSPGTAAAALAAMRHMPSVVGYDRETEIILRGRHLSAKPEWVPVNYSLPGLEGLRPTQEQYERDGESIPYVRFRVPITETYGDLLRQLGGAGFYTMGGELVQALPPPLSQMVRAAILRDPKGALRSVPFVGRPAAALVYPAAPGPGDEYLTADQIRLQQQDQGRYDYKRQLFKFGIQADWVNVNDCFRLLTVHDLRQLRKEVAAHPNEPHFKDLDEIDQEINVRQGLEGEKRRGPRTWPWLQEVPVAGGYAERVQQMQSAEAGRRARTPATRRR